MTKAPNIALIILSLTWLFYALIVNQVSRASAAREAAHMEYRLKAWAEQNTSEESLGKILDDYNELKLSDKSDQRNFRETIKDISQKSSVPAWPGLIGLICGIIWLIDRRPSPSSKNQNLRAPIDTSKP